MLRYSIFANTIVNQRKLTFWITLGILSASLYTTLLFPTVRDITDIHGFLDQLPEALVAFLGGSVNFHTPEGFLNAELFSVFGPILIIVYSTIRGATAIAGEEEARTLDQLLANPISRRRVGLEKTLAIISCLVLLSLILFVGVILGSSFSNYALDLGKLCEMIFSFFILGVTTTFISLGIGMGTGKKSLAGGITGGIMVTGFLLNGVQAAVSSVEWTKFLSVFWYYNGNQVLVNGIEFWRLGIILSFGVLVFITGQIRFQNRDMRG